MFRDWLEKLWVVPCVVFCPYEINGLALIAIVPHPTSLLLTVEGFEGGRAWLGRCTAKSPGKKSECVVSSAKDKPLEFVPEFVDDSWSLEDFFVFF